MLCILTLLADWIQGHDLGRKFKALVCHDGVFSTQNQYQSEELFFPEHDFGGKPWDNRKLYEKWDPSRFTENWATPQLVRKLLTVMASSFADVLSMQVIHSELDYRLPISEAMAMFNVLQTRDVPSKFLMFPDENHVSGVARPPKPI